MFRFGTPELEFRQRKLLGVIEYPELKSAPTYLRGLEFSMASTLVSTVRNWANVTQIFSADFFKHFITGATYRTYVEYSHPGNTGYMGGWSKGSTVVTLVTLPVVLTTLGCCTDNLKKNKQPIEYGVDVKQLQKACLLRTATIL